MPGRDGRSPLRCRLLLLLLLLCLLLLLLVPQQLCKPTGEGQQGMCNLLYQQQPILVEVCKHGLCRQQCMLSASCLIACVQRAQVPFQAAYDILRTCLHEGLPCI